MSRAKKMLRMSSRSFLSFVVACALAANATAQTASVTLTEKPLVIPTYTVGEAERAPVFYSGRKYQGAKGPIYPYPLFDKLSGEKRDKSYRALVLDNKYIQISVLPEIGGRLYTGLDKTNNYDFFYRNRVIKPALIGMTGAWISGGVEWNVPHHHRATSFTPVDYTTEEHADGSKTIWVGETELRHRMKWMVGMTVHRDKSYVETKVRLTNRTPLVHSFLYWANVAVHANENYQVIFPPDAEWFTSHNKNNFGRWTMPDDYYHNDDLRGVDVSLWKNHVSSNSLFAWGTQEDFLAGYDHGKRAGLVHVADHHDVPGKKFWLWGAGAKGKMWDEILSDEDGAYIELMVGGYSDNQPDYSFIRPYETRQLTQFWYPIRELGSIKEANIDAALGLEVKDGAARFGFNTTSERAGARALLQANGTTLFERTIDISPARPFTTEIKLPANTKETDLRLSLRDKDGAELIAYQPQPKRNTPKPEPVKPPLPPGEIKTNEELYLAGMRLEQFHNHEIEPYPYYEEALRRDRDDARVNTALGILYCKRGMYAEAEEHLARAVKRSTKGYTSPRDGEALYYLALAQREQGKDDLAIAAFRRAAWTHGLSAASYYNVAEIAARKGDKAEALAMLDRALETNSLHSKAKVLQAALLRRSNRTAEAGDKVRQVIATDPLDFFARNELALIENSSNTHRESLARLMRDDENSYLELSTDYANAGLYREAIDVLARRETAGSRHALVYYYLGYYHARANDKSKARDYYARAATLPTDYVFPFQLEAARVLRAALEANPRDARAAYYLGNLLYDVQPQEAIKLWELARTLDPSFALVHRNLGLAYSRIDKDHRKGRQSLEQALNLDSGNARFLFELDRVMEAAQVPARERLLVFERHQATAARHDDAVIQQARLYVQTGDYDKALGLISDRHFHNWEGADETLRNVFIDSHLLRGQRHLAAGRTREALADFQAALVAPKNLEVETSESDKLAQIHYLIGTTHESLGDKAEAQAAFARATAMRLNIGEGRYYQALALAELGKDAEARRIFDEMIGYAKDSLTSNQARDYFSSFGERQAENVRRAQMHYIAGLGYLGKGDAANARREFAEALKLDVNNLGAQTRLAQIESGGGTNARAARAK